MNWNVIIYCLIYDHFAIFKFLETSVSGVYSCAQFLLSGFQEWLGLMWQNTLFLGNF